MKPTFTKRLLPLLIVACTASAVFAESEAAGESGRPLLDTSSNAVESTLWVLVIFIVMAVILYRTAWKNVLTGLKGREERIRNDIAAAEAARLKAEASLKEYNASLANAESKARDIIAKATSDAAAVAERIKVDADKAAQERVERATRDIAEARDQAMREIYAQAADLATNVAEKILRRNLNVEDQRALVAQSLEQVGAVNRG